MKTKHKLFKLTSLFALLLTFLAFSPSAAKAQCPTIHNSMNCPVSVKVDFYVPDWMGTCTKFCNSYVIPNINPNQIVPINCSVCPPYCNIVVTVLTVGGAPAAGSADQFTPPPGNPVTGGTSSCVSPTSAIYYLSSMTRFRIIP